MKFEIDDKTGMIDSRTRISEGDQWDGPSFIMTSGILEKILQAVKKTQEKLVNKQIQEIQDSKSKPLRGFNPPPIMIKKNDRIFYGEESWTLEEIEQNQKLVDAMILKCKELDGTSMYGEDRIEEMVCILREITGKDIKDL